MNDRLQSLFSLDGKTAVVTGGSRGIGEMIAEGFVDAGASVIMTARKAEALQATADRLTAKGGNVTAIPGDLSTLEGVTAFADEVKSRVDSLDILVNNAGATWGAPLGEYPVEGWDKVMNVNLRSVYYLTEALIDHLRGAGTADEPARVINIGSVDGIRACDAEHYAYSSSKAAVLHLTRQLAKRLRNENVLVNAIAPGVFESNMTAFALHDEESRALVESTVPLGRIGNPDDMAGAAIFLASKAGAYLTGVTLPVGGGVATAD
ncbi:MAG: NAD(P)-dependent dehydrogenase (short-subunit alcohol dehydrogenase family) [Verrucomicrobiales bacterium]|jgi:NAD(P)-dependent dehydrogenase (short-subunit alcohol dehydrogenase family)